MRLKISRQGLEGSPSRQYQYLTAADEKLDLEILSICVCVYKGVLHRLTYGKEVHGRNFASAKTSTYIGEKHLQA